MRKMKTFYNSDAEGIGASTKKGLYSMNIERRG
jgi:hypothetical protein